MEGPLSSPACPLCGIPLRVFDIRGVAGEREGRVELDRCDICEGVWFDPGELRPYLSARGLEPAQRIAPNPPGSRDFRCPGCLEALVQVTFELEEGAQGRRTFHHCRRCAGVWLGGELKDVPVAHPFGVDLTRPAPRWMEVAGGLLLEAARVILIPF